jgi:hypothetical protein
MIHTINLKPKVYILNNLSKFIGGYTDNSTYYTVKYKCTDTEPLKIQSAFLAKYTFVKSSDIMSIK